MTHDKREGFTFGLAAVDALPVLFFAGSIAVIAGNFSNRLFFAGALCCILAGTGKVLWKFILAAGGKDWRILNRQLRVLMPTGFGIMMLSILLHWREINFKQIFWAMITFPAAGCFLVGEAGIAGMCVAAAKLDGADAKANWMEQGINIVAQAAFFAGILLMSFQ